MSDKNGSDGGCADTTASFVASQAGTTQAMAPESPAGYQDVPQGMAQNIPQEMPQNMQGYAAPQGAGNGGGVFYAEPAQSEAGNTRAVASPEGQAVGTPAAGQPQEVSAQWHEAFHLKPENGYMYQEAQMETPQYIPAMDSVAQAHGFQGSPMVTGQNGYHGSQSPQYVEPAYAAMSQPGMAQTGATRFAAPQTPYQAPAQGPVYAQQTYPGTPQGGQAFMRPMAEPVTPAMMGGQPGYMPAYVPGNPAGFTENMAQTAAFAGAAPVAGPAEHASTNGSGHCKGNCSRHMYGGEETAGMDSAAAAGFNPFSLFGPAGEAFASQFGQFGQSGQFPGQFANQTGAEDPKHLENKYGQLLEIYSDLMQGKTDPAKIMSFLTSTGTYFWKGALVGAVLTLILTNDSVKSTLKECLGAVLPGKE